MNLFLVFSFHFFCFQDEIHERDRFSDFLLISLRDLLASNRSIKVILMSAALDINLFTKYFNGCPVIQGMYLIENSEPTN